MEDNFDYKNDLYNILDAVPVSVYWKDKEGKYLGCNKYMANLAGLTRNAIIGRTDSELLWKDASNSLHDIDYIVIKNKAKYEAEEKTKMDNGDERTFLSTKIPLYNSKKAVVGLVGISLDITDRKRAEELHIKNEVAERAVTFSNIVAADIAHELKNPLAAINISMEHIMDGLLSEKLHRSRIEFYKKEFAKITKIIRGCSYIISDLLQKVKSLVTGKIHVSLKLNQIDVDIEEMLDLYPFVNEEKKLVELKNFEKKNSFKYMGDSTITQNVFSNLVKNSLREFKEIDHKGLLTIELKKNAEKDFNYVIFRDNGRGIREENIDTIFNNFESKNVDKGGTGLGLSFCRLVMKSYDGDITCESEEGKYTEFTLKFPKV